MRGLMRLTALLLGISSHPLALSDPFHYTHIAHEPRHLTIDPSAKVIIAGDRAEPASFCSPNNAFHCFTNRWITFAIPKSKRLESTSSWLYGGNQFNVGKTRDIRLLGKRVLAVEIRSKQSEAEITFLFSENLGLIGIETSIEGLHSLHILEEAKGFASK